MLLIGPGNQILAANHEADRLFDTPPGGLTGHAIGQFLVAGSPMNLALPDLVSLENVPWFGTLKIKARSGSPVTVMVTVVSSGHQHLSVKRACLIARKIHFEKPEEESLQDRIRYETAISQAAFQLSHDTPDAVNKTLMSMLMISKAHRAYIFENFSDEDGDLLCRQTFEQCVPGVEPQIDNEILQKLSYEKSGLGRLRDQLSSHQVMSGHVRDFPQMEREILEPQGIKTILIFPIFLQNEWFGYIGFDYLFSETLLPETDVVLLSTAAELLGNYFQKKRQFLSIQQKNEELIRLNQDKDRIMKMLSHDLKGPAGSLMAHLDLIMTHLGEYDTAHLKKQMSKVYAAAQAGHQLLTDLLLWTQSQSGGLTFKPGTVDLKGMVDAALKDVNGSLITKSIDMDVQIDPDLLVVADQNTLRIVFRNLLSNAIKYSWLGGTIRVAAAKKTDAIQVVFEDNGTGMSPDTLQSLWSEEGSLQKPGTGNEPGTGIGLILCRELVMKNRGTIRAESEPGKGSRFFVTLPAAINELN